MIEAVMLWNEPNNMSHWDFVDVDHEWRIYSDMVILAAQAVAAENPRMPRVLGGISPIDPLFIQRMARQGALAAVEYLASVGERFGAPSPTARADFCQASLSSRLLVMDNSSQQR